MIIEVAAGVDIGNKEANDDRVLVNGQILDASIYAGKVYTPAVAAVCDGCGGYKGGDIAAQTVLEFLAAEDATALSDSTYLSKVLDDCQKTIIKKKKDMSQFAEMCTTIAGCVFCDNNIVIFHSGDSRVYRHDKWGIARMTRDHSVVQEMIDIGEITPEEALKHPKRNIISRCIGIEGRPPEIYVSASPIHPGEKFLLCSDGLWESVSDYEISCMLKMNCPLQEMVDALILKALDQNADDNISVCICSLPGNSYIEEKRPFILD